MLGGSRPPVCPAQAGPRRLGGQVAPASDTADSRADVPQTGVTRSPSLEHSTDSLPTAPSAPDTVHARTTYDVCGVRISADAPRVAARVLAERGRRGQPFQVHLCNTYTLSLTDRDVALRAALLASDYNLPDGAPVAWLGWRHGVRGPVRGPGLVLAVAEEGVELDLKHYLLGGAPGVADAMAERLMQLVPHLDIVGCESPPFHDLDADEIAAVGQRVKSAGTNVLWIGVGTPRQDHLVPQIAPVAGCVVIPVGAAFDYLAGRVPEAPQLLQGHGLEWAYRLTREPRRLWRRYLLESPRFALSALRAMRRS